MMSDKSLETILDLTIELRRTKQALGVVNRLNAMRNKRQKLRLEQLDEKAYEIDLETYHAERTA